MLVILKHKALSSRILLEEFLPGLLHFGQEHLVVVGGQAVILGLPSLRILVVGLQRRQHVLGQVGCGVVLGLGVGEESIQEEQEDEKAEDEFVADEFFAFVPKHGLFLFGEFKNGYCAILKIHKSVDSGLAFIPIKLLIIKVLAVFMSVETEIDDLAVHFHT